ncbi:MAG: ABC transporter ATP-binding protein [Oscillospiraceae bacterium]|jgi:lipopolysaccharide transport system ATP-binding protein|nr:ABC transporter ATP-binding protein [Oscillospiraceae bacterium]
MEPVVIRAEGVGKRYRISSLGRPENALTDRGSHALSKAAARVQQTLHNVIHARKKEDFWALRGIGLEIRRGECVGIIGKNGAGKSTLLKLLSRITEPTEGRIELTGRLSAMLEVGTGFHPELTGRENVYLNGAILGMRKTEIDAKFGAILEFSEIGKFIDTPVKRYSSGMFVRLAFAVAAHMEPDILVVDEVLAVGDARFQKKCLDQMSAVAENGCTVLYVSHNMATIRQMCTRAICLKEGRVIFDGDVEEGIRQYQAEGGAHETDIDLTQRERMDFLSGEATMTRLELLDTRDCVYAYEEPIRFRLHFCSHTEIDRPVTLRVELHDSRGAVGMSYSEAFAPQLAAGNHTAVFSFAGHCLAPGSYTIALGLGTGDNFGAFSTLDCVYPTFAFEVLGREGPEGREVWRANWGSIHLPPCILDKTGA